MMHFNKYYFIFLIGAAWGCSQRERNNSIEITWTDNKAIEIILLSPSLADLPEAELSRTIKVELGDTNEPMLGEFLKRNGQVVFQPVVPFSRGMHYHVLVNGLILNEVDIPVDENAKTPEVSIYPSADTVPENILKMYLQFSEAMVEGKSYRHIHLLNSVGDTLEGTFLDLQPELWNNDGTVLTLWFDPGRVKRDLIPNKTFGNPIVKGHEYTVVISREWKSKSGKEIGRQTIKKFRVAGRDEKIPEMNRWTLDLPKIGTTAELFIDFSEPLDFSLIQSTIQIQNEGLEILQLDASPADRESAIRFSPARPWQKGNYILRVESRLEDLAGNNLLRPFDRDISKGEIPSDKKYFERKFRIE